MVHIWHVLLQTLAVSLVAAFLLVIKALLHDKLSPRWQYGIWSLLALRILLPVDTTKNLLFPLPLWVELIKSQVELFLDSAYCSMYSVPSAATVLPLISRSPQSVTDWLFVLYCAGIVMFLGWYLLSYVRLRLVLLRAVPAQLSTLQCIQHVCDTYQLNTCRAVEVQGLSSAFICGVFRPVLVLPAACPVDEKILLHELLHFKYLDNLQTIFWCVMRCLHWCNPFMHVVIHRIENDMESLCDQRVLEHLNGEARREYGRILLDMANNHYARTPGTTSISNGGKNIARRIAAIAHFKRYPSGMGLVSVCMFLILVSPLLLGTPNTNVSNYLSPSGREERPQEWMLQKGMAAARLYRCTTVAGAADTYAKGLIQKNGLYLAAASPLSCHVDLSSEMDQNVQAGLPLCSIDPGNYLCDNPASIESYQLFNLVQRENGSYDASLALFSEEVSPFDSTRQYSTILIPVEIRQEYGWVIEETGPRKKVSSHLSELDADPLHRITLQGKTGTVTIDTSTSYQVDNNIVSGTMFPSSHFDLSPKLDANFEISWLGTHITYTAYTPSGPSSSAGLLCLELENLDDPYEMPKVHMSGNQSGSSSSGYTYSSNTIGPDWNGTIHSGHGTGFYDLDKQFPISSPGAYRVFIYWDGEIVEEFTWEEEKLP